MRVLISVLLVLSGGMTSALAKPAPVLEPSSEWILDYADNNCRLVRMFGSDKDAIKLVFEQVAPQSPMTLMLVGKFDAQGDENTLAFDPLADVRIGGGQSLNAVNSHDNVVFWPRGLGRGQWGLVPESVSARMRNADPSGTSNSLASPRHSGESRVQWQQRDWAVEPDDQWRAEDAAFSARADQVTTVVLNPGRYGSVSLHTGALAKPLQALEECATNSLKDWGIDPAVESTIVTSAHPVTDPHTLFSASDYPTSAARSWAEDNLEVWLNIDAQGRIASCRVISDFASPQINGAICGMIERKESFVPARTKDGTAVPDYYIQSFVFRLRH